LIKLLGFMLTMLTAEKLNQSFTSWRPELLKMKRN
jgi:hypothetical protein